MENEATREAIDQAHEKDELLPVDSRQPTAISFSMAGDDIEDNSRQENLNEEDVDVFGDEGEFAVVEKHGLPIDAFEAERASGPDYPSKSGILTIISRSDVLEGERMGVKPRFF